MFDEERQAEVTPELPVEEAAAEEDEGAEDEAEGEAEGQ